jgi:hypothetical protein
VRPSSKFFTPCLTAAHRVSFFRCLGLSHYAFRYFEVSGKHVLSASVFDRSKIEVRLTPSTSEEWLKERNICHLPVITLHHPSGELAHLATQSQRSIWEEVFPPPFSTVIFGLGKSDLRQVEIYPDPAKLPLLALAKALSSLEERMKEAEVGFLWVRNGAVRFPLLFHFVRRKRVRLGSSSFLFDVGEKFDRGEISKENLVEIFGTHALLVCVDISPLRERDPIDAVGDALRGATFLGTDILNPSLLGSTSLPLWTP